MEKCIRCGKEIKNKEITEEYCNCCYLKIVEVSNEHEKKYKGR